MSLLYHIRKSSVSVTLLVKKAKKIFKKFREVTFRNRLKIHF